MREFKVMREITKKTDGIFCHPDCEDLLRWEDGEDTCRVHGELELDERDGVYRRHPDCQKEINDPDCYYGYVQKCGKWATCRACIERYGEVLK